MEVAGFFLTVSERAKLCLRQGIARSGMHSGRDHGMKNWSEID